MSLVQFLASSPGRIARAGAGIVLIAVGLLLGHGWYVLAAVGLLPLTAGVFDFSLLGPLMRLPLAGRALRRAVEGRTAN